MNKTLVPVSVSNDVYSTENVVSVINKYIGHSDYIEILIADRIQMYNRVVKEVSRRKGGVDIDRVEDGVRKTSDERKAWSSVVVGRFDVKKDRIRVRDVNSYVDANFLDIFRRVLILYEVDNIFRKDVEDYARVFVSRREYPTRELSYLAERMSVRYILEEAAISVRVRCLEGFFVEAYIGAFARPILNIYRDEYQFGLSELSGLREIDPGRFEFHDIAPPLRAGSDPKG